MREITLGRTGEGVSVISLGTWSFGGANTSGKQPVGWAGQSNDDSKTVLTRCWEKGINHWDTADVYGNGRSEQVIGSMWETIPRKDIFLATKVGWDKMGDDRWYDPDHMRRNMERSLINLQTDTVDLLYLHHCNFGKNNEYFDDAVNMVRRFKEEGKARFIGLSDWDSFKIMRFIEKADPDVVQPYRNVWQDSYENSGLKKYIEDNNLGVCFFSPLMHGLLTGKYSSPTTFEPGDFRENISAFKDRGILEKIKNNASFLKDWFSNHPHPVMRGVIDTLISDSKNSCVLLGQRNRTQVDAALTLGELLDKSEIDWVKKLYEH